MKTRKQMVRTVRDIYREMYAKATPQADFDELMRKGITKKEGWFMSYYLDEEIQETIIKKHCKGCSGREKMRISGEVNLGSSPTSIKK